MQTILKFFKNIETDFLESLTITKFTMQTTLICFFITHAYFFLGSYANEDHHHTIYNSPTMITSGRWLGSINNYLSPWVVGITCAILLALSVLCVVMLFNINNKLNICLISFMMVSFPSLAYSYGYLFQADRFSISLFTAVFSVWITTKYKWGFILGGISLMISLAEYQSYIGVSVSLCLIKLIYELISEENKVQDIIILILKYAFMGLLGVSLYFKGLDLALLVNNTVLSDYKGVDTMGEINRTDIEPLLTKTYTRFFEFFTGDEFFYTENNTTIMYYLNMSISIFLLSFYSIKNIFYSFNNLNNNDLDELLPTEYTSEDKNEDITNLEFTDSQYSEISEIRDEFTSSQNSEIPNEFISNQSSEISNKSISDKDYYNTTNTKNNNPNIFNTPYVQNIIKSLFLIIFIIFMPLAFNFVDFIAPETFSSTLNIYQIVFLFLLPLFLVKNDFKNIMTLLTIFSLTSICLTNFSSSNLYYLKLSSYYEQTAHFYNRLFMRIESFEDFDANLPLAIIGDEYNDFYGETFDSFPQIQNDQGLWNRYIGVNSYYYDAVLRKSTTMLENILGVRMKRASEDDVLKLINTKEYRMLDTYPANNCIDIINDILVVKLTNSWKIEINQDKENNNLVNFELMYPPYEDAEGYQVAWYVHKNDEHIYTRWYEDNTKLIYNFTKPGTYFVTCYVMNEDEYIIETFDSGYIIIE